MDSKRDQITEYKIEVFVPLCAKDRLLLEIRELHIGQIGKYHNCISCSTVQSSWTADEDSDPYIGQTGKDCELEEIKIETRCSNEQLDATIQAIKKVHPYENVCINVIPILSI